jgi:light-regulated signal transduction histidine kinase (bacteriophytochrome)
VDYIVKPYHPTVLLSKVRVFLEMHTQRRELERNRERLAAINRELEAFAFSVSHDLRAPVEAIEGFGQALVEDQSEVLDEQGKDYLNRIVGESRRMSKLIDALLRLSRIARTEITWQKVDISSQAQEIVTRLRESEPARSAEVSINENLEAVGDPQLLAQLLENLVSNAWKFTAKNERTYIEIGRTFVDGRPAFFVRDNGVGFDMRYADKLFAPFQRLHSMKEFPGTGIGLSTVQRIAARHGGRVWFNSALGEGSTFYFALSDEATGNL